jgi:hypothetical protein
VDILQVLPLVLEHGGIHQPERLCKLLLLSKSFKQALKSCKVPCLRVDIDITVNRGELATTVPGFALWFAQYGHLVHELVLECSVSEEDHDNCTAAQTLISLAVSGAAPNGLCAPGLQEFRADSRFCGPAMLSSLPAHSIKLMDLTMTSADIAAPLLPLIFQQFSNLQTLFLRVDDTWGGKAGNVQTDVVQLNSAFFLGLPPSLEALSFCCNEAKYLLDIGHLTFFART